MANWKTGNPPQNGEYLTTNKDGRIRIHSFTTNLYKIDEYDFSEYKRKKDKSGWYEYDSEWGFCELHNIIAWMELPEPYDVTKIG